MSRKQEEPAQSDKKLWDSAKKENKYFQKDSTKTKINIGNKLFLKAIRLFHL